MKLFYRPEGQPEQTFDFEPESATSVEAEAAEDWGGTAWDSWPEFLEKVASGHIRARRVLLWLMLRRSNPKPELRGCVVPA